MSHTHTLTNKLSNFNYLSKKRIPYNWKNPTGYLVTVFLQIYLSVSTYRFVGCLNFIAFGAFMFSITPVKILKNELHAINGMARRKKFRKNMFKKLSEFIRSNALHKQLIMTFVDLYEYTLTAIFAVSIISICATMLLVQIQIVK